MSLPYMIREMDREADLGFILGSYGACCAHGPGIDARNRRWVRRCAQALCLRVVDDSSRWKTLVAALPNGQLVGWIAVRDEGGDSARLLFCYVKHSFRRENISRELLRMAIPAARSIRMTYTPVGAAGAEWLKRMGVEIDEGRMP